MLNVKIISPALREQPFTSKRDGKPGILPFQTAWVQFVDREGKTEPFPSKVEFIADRDEQGRPQPYAPGDYTLHPSAVYLDRASGRLAATLRLTPLPKRTA